MSCDEKERLAKEYETATSIFSEAVRELHRKIGNLRRTNMSGSNEHRAKLVKNTNKQDWRLNNTLPLIGDSHDRHSIVDFILSTSTTALHRAIAASRSVCLQHAVNVSICRLQLIVFSSR